MQKLLYMCISIGVSVTIVTPWCQSTIIVSLVLVTPPGFFVWYRGQVTAESMFLMAAAIAYRYSNLSKGNDAQHWMKACLKWVIGTVHIRYICLSLLVILEVEDITRKCTFGHITKKRGGLSRHTISSAPFLQSRQWLNPKMFLKQIKTYWNILIV